MNLFSIINRKVFGGADVRQFVGISLNKSCIQEKVFFNTHDVTNYQWILCQSPFVIGIWFPFRSDICLSDSSTNSLVLISYDEKKKIGEAKIKFIKKLNYTSGSLCLFSFVQAKSFQLNQLKKYFLYLIFLSQRKQELTYSQLKFFASGFSFPRKVVLVVYADPEYHNFFPMDFQGYIPEENIQLLGLRQTNISLKRIISQRKIMVCEVDAREKEELYKWGKHHSQDPPPIESIKTHSERSHHFNFPVPQIARAYKEVEIIDTVNLGSHTLLIGKVMFSHEYHKENSPLYHIHLFQYIKNLHQKNYYTKLT